MLPSGWQAPTHSLVYRPFGIHTFKHSGFSSHILTLNIQQVDKGNGGQNAYLSSVPFIKLFLLCPTALSHFISLLLARLLSGLGTDFYHSSHFVLIKSWHNKPSPESQKKSTKAEDTHTLNSPKHNTSSSQFAEPYEIHSVFNLSVQS